MLYLILNIVSLLVIYAMEGPLKIGTAKIFEMKYLK